MRFQKITPWNLKQIITRTIFFMTQYHSECISYECEYFPQSDFLLSFAFLSFFFYHFLISSSISFRALVYICHFSLRFCLIVSFNFVFSCLISRYFVFCNFFLIFADFLLNQTWCPRRTSRTVGKF